MGVCTMGMLRILPFVLLAGGVSALAQAPTYGVGRTPSAEEIRAWDISLGPPRPALPPAPRRAHSTQHRAVSYCS